ncbi:MAG TPA: DUF177 domain-containing protein [Rhizomicrobium sp.]|jgi:uncharacterized metal-binding protein YceD (DUF177 family)|nr:DUF177 domain-containing protein [Rhizomicrobium sp.]
MSDFPISHPYELGRLSLAGDKIVLAPTQEEYARIAQWAGVDAMESFKATIEIKKLTPTRFSYDAAFEADIVQSCVVTLDPVRSHIEGSVVRDLFLTQTTSFEVDVAPVDEDGREEIASLRYDLAAPVLEELVLAIDPYPRAPGVEFESPVAEDKPEHPFAALKGLKP